MKELADDLLLHGLFDDLDSACDPNTTNGIHNEHARFERPVCVRLCMR